MTLDFSCYRPTFCFQFDKNNQLTAADPLAYARSVKDAYSLWRSQSPLRVSGTMPKMAPCLLPTGLQFIHVQRCGCKNGACSFVTGLSEVACGTVGDLWKLWADKKHDSQIGRWFERNDGVFLKFKALKELPLVGDSCLRPNETRHSGLVLRPRVAYIAFYYSPCH